MRLCWFVRASITTDRARGRGRGGRKMKTTPISTKHEIKTSKDCTEPHRVKLSKLIFFSFCLVTLSPSLSLWTFNGGRHLKKKQPEKWLSKIQNYLIPFRFVYSSRPPFEFIIIFYYYWILFSIFDKLFFILFPFFHDIVKWFHNRRFVKWNALKRTHTHLWM